MNISAMTDEEILRAVTPIMDGLMQGSTDVDYAKHTRDATDRVKAILTPERLENVCAEYQGRIGFFAERELVALFRRKTSVAVVWKQACTKSDDEFVAEAVFIPTETGWRWDHAMVF